MNIMNLSEEIVTLEDEIHKLRIQLQKKEERLLALREQSKNNDKICQKSEKIPRWAIERYSRQALLTELGPSKDIISKLIKSSILIIGAGGLGSPAALYLAGAGVGHIGIVDYDEVEITNIHRQPLHSELSVGKSKVDSAATTLRRLNSNIVITCHKEQLNSSNALSIISKYDLIIDATDNAVTRYLINDACVFLGKPLISAAALQLYGQFTVYNYPIKSNTPEAVSENGPCYRCVFPNPPPAEVVGSCSQNGVLGPVPGLMGCLQAIEAIKIILGKESIAGYLLMFDASDYSFNKVKLRRRAKDCPVCSENPTITKLIDYEKFCNAQASDKELKLDILSSDERIRPIDFSKNVFPKIDLNENIPSKNTFDALDLQDRITPPIVLFDVRSLSEFSMCGIEKSMCYPINKINYETLVKTVKEKNVKEVYFLCRRGNDSQIAAREFKNTWMKLFKNETLIIKDIEGGLHAWSATVDPDIPVY